MMKARAIDKVATVRTNEVGRHQIAQEQPHATSGTGGFDLKDTQAIARVPGIAIHSRAKQRRLFKFRICAIAIFYLKSVSRQKLQSEPNFLHWNQRLRF
jgi:hypothetical protein